LVARRGGLGFGATFANDIRPLAASQSFRFHPCLERDGIPVLEVEDAVGARVLEAQMSAFSIEGCGLVLFLEPRVVRTTGSSLFELDVARDCQARLGVPFEGPSWNRLHRGSASVSQKNAE
jgi:hypothetical protein